MITQKTIAGNNGNKKLPRKQQQTQKNKYKPMLRYKPPNSYIARQPLIINRQNAKIPATTVSQIDTNNSNSSAESKEIIQITVPQIMTDAEIAGKEGHFFEREHYKQVAGGQDCDIYGTRMDGTRILLAKLRTGVLGQRECRDTYNALEPFARKTWNVNRGAAAGQVSLRKLPKYVGEVVQKKEGGFRLYYRGKDGKLRQDNISNRVRSNIIGFYDQPDRNKLAGGQKAPKIPCRMTAWTRDHPHEWQKTIIPLVEQIDRQFAQLLPDRHQVQLQRASKTPDFQIPKTAFSTMTVNYNYQSANHKDAGDLDEGFGNLIVLERDKCIRADSDTNAGIATSYEGGLLGFPQYGVALDVRQGDFCAVNVHEWHCNTRIVPSIGANNLEQNSDKENVAHKSQTKGAPETWGRMTLVCYLRKGMLSKCGARY
jgi:hypothetical protein